MQGNSPYQSLKNDSLQLLAFSDSLFSVNPAVAYYCMLYVARKANDEGKAIKEKGGNNPGIDHDLNILVTKLEQMKNAAGPFNKTNDEMKVQMFLDDLLITADTEYMNSNFSQATIQSFMKYVAILEIMNIFGPFSEDNTGKSSICPLIQENMLK